jgi:hypothetical protein
MAPQTAVVTAESSNSEILSSMNAKERATWRQTGELPEAKPKETKEAKETPAESSPAAKTEVTEPEAQKPAAESSAAPVVAEKEHKPNKGAEARIKELLADNKRLSAELETARKAPVIAPAKTEEVAKPRRNDVDAKTGVALYASDDAFEDALEKYLVATVTANVNKANEKAASESRIKAQNEIIEKKWFNSIKIAKEKYPDFDQVLDVGDEDRNGKPVKGVFRNKELKSIKTNGVVDAWILDSEAGA